MRRKRSLTTVLTRIRELAIQRRVRFTLKAFRELVALDVGLDEEDACHLLANLAGSDFVERLASKRTGEWMYVFKPSVGEVIVYLKLILRSECVVISFHGEEDQTDEDD
jgi:Motility quorum-sensing regulator, toxin of MqsA